MDSIRDKVVVITGAARGIGYELAKQLSAHGARIALLGLEPEALAYLADELTTPVRYWEVDIANHAKLAKVASEVIGHFGKVDVVVANAGIAQGGPVQYSDPLIFNKIIEVNLLGSVNTGRAFAEELKKSQGYFLQIASLAAIVSSPWLAAYCASKSGADAFARSFGYELQYFGVRVGVAYLSWVDTDMVRTADKDTATREMREGLPWPLNKTYSLEFTARVITRGIIERKYSIYVQKWVGVLSALRGLTNNLFTRWLVDLKGNLEAKWLSSNQVKIPATTVKIATTRKKK